MVDVKISDLPAAAAFLATMEIEVNDSGTSRKTNGDQIKTMAQTDLGALSSKNTINDGDWSGTDLTVANGGTGVSSFTDGGVVIGNATGALQVTTAGTVGQVLTSNGAGSDPSFQDIPSAIQGQVSQTSSTRTLVLTDAQKLIVLTSNAVNLNSNLGPRITVPNNSSVAFPIGTTIEFLSVQPGSQTSSIKNILAALRFVPDSGVTINGPKAIPGFNKIIRLTKTGTDVWAVGANISNHSAFIADYVPVFGASGASSSVTSNIGANTGARDLGILVVQTANQPISTPSGWTSITSSSTGSAGTGQSVQLFYADGSAGHSASFTASGRYIVQLFILNNIRTNRSGNFIASGIDASANSVASTTTTALTFPNITTTEPNDLLICACSMDSGVNASNTINSLAEPSSVYGTFSFTVNQLYTGSNIAGGASAVVFYVKPTTGATSGLTGTLGDTSTQALVSTSIKPGYGLY